MVWWLRKHRPDKREVPIGPICIRFAYKQDQDGIFLLSGRCLLVNSLRQKNKRPRPIYVTTTVSTQSNWVGYNKQAAYRPSPEGDLMESIVREPIVRYPGSPDGAIKLEELGLARVSDGGHDGWRA